MRFALTPPTEGDYLTTQLWDKFLPRWREPHTPASHETKAKVKAYAESLSDWQARREGTRGLSQPESGPHDPLAVERHVHARRGKWQVIPPEVVKASKPVETARNKGSD